MDSATNSFLLYFTVLLLFFKWLSPCFSLFKEQIPAQSQLLFFTVLDYWTFLMWSLLTLEMDFSLTLIIILYISLYYLIPPREKGTSGAVLVLLVKVVVYTGVWYARVLRCIFDVLLDERVLVSLRRESFTGWSWTQRPLSEIFWYKWICGTILTYSVHGDIHIWWWLGLVIPRLHLSLVFSY